MWFSTSRPGNHHVGIQIGNFQRSTRLPRIRCGNIHTRQDQLVKVFHQKRTLGIVKVGDVRQQEVADRQSFCPREYFRDTGPDQFILGLAEVASTTLVAVSNDAVAADGQERMSNAVKYSFY